MSQVSELLQPAVSAENDPFTIGIKLDCSQTEVDNADQQQHTPASGSAASRSNASTPEHVDGTPTTLARKELAAYLQGSAFTKTPEDGDIGEKAVLKWWSR